MDVFTELENIGNLPPSERSDVVHNIKLQAVTACKNCTTRIEVTEKIETMLKIKEKTPTGFMINYKNANKYDDLSLDLISEANRKFNITKLR